MLNLFYVWTWNLKLEDCFRQLWHLSSSSKHTPRPLTTFWIHPECHSPWKYDTTDHGPQFDSWCIKRCHVSVMWRSCPHHHRRFHIRRFFYGPVFTVRRIHMSNKTTPPAWKQISYNTYDMKKNTTVYLKCTSGSSVTCFSSTKRFHLGDATVSNTWSILCFVF